MQNSKLTKNKLYNPRRLIWLKRLVMDKLRRDMLVTAARPVYKFEARRRTSGLIKHLLTCYV